jgi:prepilin-type N-terminal cleavage/methylation domain-containing protein/prepilin-type processing-associated H-X9-DG protein
MVALMRTSADGVRAFTLIELLAVLAIIALLATLGSVGWQRSQRDARSAACTQNLRALGVAMARYVGEHEGIYPELAMARATRSDAALTIDTALASYVGEQRVFACPDDRKHIAEVSGTSYLWNWKLNGQRLVSLSVSFVATSPIDEPGHTMMMGDKEGFHEHLQNKLNVLYADGHVSQELTFLSDTPPKN